MRDGAKGVALEKLPDYCNIVVWNCKSYSMVGQTSI